MAKPDEMPDERIRPRFGIAAHLVDLSNLHAPVEHDDWDLLRAQEPERLGRVAGRDEEDAVHLAPHEDPKVVVLQRL